MCHKFSACLHPGERSYDPAMFHNRVERVLIDDHNVPRLRLESFFFFFFLHNYLFIFFFFFLFIFFFIIALVHVHAHVQAQTSQRIIGLQNEIYVKKFYQCSCKSPLH